MRFSEEPTCERRPLVGLVEAVGRGRARRNVARPLVGLVGLRPLALNGRFLGEMEAYTGRFLAEAAWEER